MIVNYILYVCIRDKLELRNEINQSMLSCIHHN